MDDYDKAKQETDRISGRDFTPIIKPKQVFKRVANPVKRVYNILASNEKFAGKPLRIVAIGRKLYNKKNADKYQQFYVALADNGATKINTTKWGQLELVCTIGIKKPIYKDLAVGVVFTQTQVNIKGRLHNIYKIVSNTTTNAKQI